MSVSSPHSVLTFSSPTRPELRISCSWDSVHITCTGDSLKNIKALTTGRWKTQLMNSEYDVLDIEEVGRKMILNTKSKVVLLQRDPQSKNPVFESELEASGMSFLSLDDGSVYALLQNGHFCSCTISQLKNDSLTRDTISIGPQLPTNGVPIEKACCGTDHVLLLSTNHTLFSFGLNSRGQLGHGDIETKTQPTLIILHWMDCL